MRVEKEKHKVNIICEDGSMVRGFIHINPGERVIDFFNDEKENFIVVTNAEFYIEKVHSFKLITEAMKKKEVIVLNKSTIKLVEEI